MADCVANKTNLGVSKCTKFPALIRTMITVPDNFEITKEDALTLAAWQAELLKPKSQRSYLWPMFIGFENVSEDAIYEETALADIAVRDGKYRFRVHLKQDLCLHKAMFSHRSNNSGRVILVDTEGQFVMTEKANGKLSGFSLSLLNTEKIKFNDGSVSSRSPVYLVLADNKEMDKAGYIVDGSFYTSLAKLTDVAIEVVSAGASSIVVTVQNVCDGSDVAGLLLADFVAKNAAGAAIVISGVVNNSDGTYTLSSAAAFVNNMTLDLRAASLLTVKAY